MKLVDILARELRAWPYGFGKKLGQCAFGALHSHANPAHQTGQRFTLCDSYMHETVTKKEWQAAVDALKAEVRPTESMALHHQEVGRITRQWNGEGLPPVGTVCNYKESDQVRIITHADQKGGPTLAVGQFGERGMMVFATAESRAFRPIRTPEQIAAEEIQKIRDVIKWQKPQLGPCPVEQMYLLGYRKFEIVDN